MRIWKLVSGILSIVFFIIIAFQSCATGVANTLNDINPDNSGTSGIIVAILVLVAGIVSVSVWKYSSKGADVALSILFGLAAYIGLTTNGIFKDLEVWSYWCILCALTAIISICIPNKKEDTPKNNNN